MKSDSWYAVESKKRCRELGLDPNVIPSACACLLPEQLTSRHEEYKEMILISRHFLFKMFEQVKGIPFLFAITDKFGYLLETMGDPTIRSLMTQLGIKDGVQFNENDQGTNAIILALRHNRPIELVGKEHYHTFLHGAACYSVPIRLSEADSIAGIISMMTMKKHHTPLMIGLLNSVVHFIERELKH